jgi:acyl-CoA thioesterase I
MKRNCAILALLALVALSFWSGCDSSERNQGAKGKNESSTTTTRGTIVCVGNSLTEGYGVPEEAAYPVLLEKRLEKEGYPFKVINAGVSGETSSGTLSRIEWIKTLKPDIVILEIGANDGLRGVDPRLTKENVTAIVKALKKERIIVILAGMEMLRNMGPIFTAAFREIYAQVATEENLIRIPFFLEGVAGKSSLNQADGIHPTAEGYRIITEKILPYVRIGIDAYEKMKPSEPR